MPNTGKRKHKVRPGSMKGYKPKRKHGTPYKAPDLSAQDKAALENMQPVVVRSTDHSDTSYPETYDHDSGWMGEYSIRSSNRPRR